MLIKKVLEAAKPYLEGKKVNDLVVGLALISCELDSGEVGISYVLREGLASGGCSRFKEIQAVIGQSALEVAEYAVSGTDNIQRSVGISVLTAAAHKMDIPDDKSRFPFGLDLTSADRVAMVGYIEPVAKEIKGAVKELAVFDKGMPPEKAPAGFMPTERQSQVLPSSDVVLITGTTMINNSIDQLVSLCTSAREVVIVGPSTPMYPRGFRESPVTRLAGSFWPKDKKKEIFRSISLAGGISPIVSYMQKKVMKVHP